MKAFVILAFSLPSALGILTVVEILALLQGVELLRAGVAADAQRDPQTL
jgi:hypothetical protein